MAMISDNDLTSLFLKQSLLDCESDYLKSKTDSLFPHFDVIALTAANEKQADIYKSFLKRRTLPSGTEFIVVPDKNGERVGSGGATLSVIKYVREKYGSFSGLKVACIHSGGFSQRMPNYSLIGKIFSPVPRMLPDGRRSTLFDEFLILLSSIACRITEGMILFSGDVLLMFNPLQIDFSGADAAAISFKANVETCKNHGVFLKNDSDYVKRFLHKQSVSTLIDAGAVDERGNCCIDTGTVILSTAILESLYELVEADAGVSEFINSKARISLYGDFLYPLADDSTLDSFLKEAPEGAYCDELISARKKLWNVLHSFRLRVLSLSPSKFLHFGTTREYLDLMDLGYQNYTLLGWNRVTSSYLGDNVSAAAYNSVIEDCTVLGDGCYAENSYIHSDAVIGDNCLFSFVDVSGVNIPSETVLHAVKQTNGKFVCRIYGISDNPKDNKLFGLDLKDSFIGHDGPLWTAEIYPEKDSVREAINASLNLYSLMTDTGGDYIEWDNSVKKSLSSGFDEADLSSLSQWMDRMESYIFLNNIKDNVSNCIPVGSVSDINKPILTEHTADNWLSECFANIKISDLKRFSTLIRLYWYAGVLLENNSFKSRSFKAVSDYILNASNNNSSIHFKDKSADNVTVSLPLRVNWGGGWTDTPPYCIENGGTVLNAAIKLDGKLPVLVTVNRTDNNKIVLVSRDLNAYGEFDSIEALQDTGNPFDLFSLQKACLLAIGLVPFKGGNISDVLSAAGGGFVLHSQVTNVPKGSGLGTSSILAAACVKAMLEYLTVDYNEQDIIAYVLKMEQIMSTGGGWQDQVGGLIPGIKLITSEPGFEQLVHIENVEISEETKTELNERFCLIYTGQRRLARNLLRDVVGRYLGNDDSSLFAHNQIKSLAVKMKDALIAGDIDRLADLLNEHWELSKIIDPGTTNTLIDHIMVTVSDDIDGRFICGAGGGGFLQVILKKGVRKADLRKKLKDVFQDFGVDVWDCEILY